MEKTLPHWEWNDARKLPYLWRIKVQSEERVFKDFSIILKTGKDYDLRLWIEAGHGKCLDYERQ